jgi:hypothetical protein
MSETWYFDATESNAHADIGQLYPTRDHPDLADAEQVRPITDPDPTIPRVTDDENDDGGQSGEDDDSGFDYESFAGQHWRTRVSQIESGDVDDHLSTIAEQTGSDTVAEAVEKRRNE